MEVLPATLADLDYIVSLAKKEGQAVGFIPKIAYEAAITGKKTQKNRWSDVCNDRIFLVKENDDPVGFVLMSYGRIAKVGQIAIQEDARLIERGKGLLTAAMDVGIDKGILEFGCGCADDLESNKFWHAMGWQKVSQRKGRRHSNTWRDATSRTVNIYRKQVDSLFDVAL